MIYGYRYGWDRYYREQLSEAAGDAGAAMYSSQRALDSVEDLRIVVREQQEHIEELSIAVGVLVKLLSDAGGIDADVLRARVQADLEALAEAKAAERAKGQPPAQLIRCVRCDKRVPIGSTQVTTEGATCDSCMALGL